MASHSNAEHEEDITELPTSDDDSIIIIDDDSGGDFEGEEMTDEDWEKFVSTKYYPGLQNLKPMKDPLTVPWDAPLSDTDVDKLKRGFKSRNMDDKYEVLVEDPDENGYLSIHIIRFLLRTEEYILRIIPHASKDVSGSLGARLESLTWETNKPGKKWKTKAELQCDAEQAKEHVLLLARDILDCEFETLP